MSTPTTAVAKPIIRGYWGDVWHRFRRRRLSMIALLFILCLLFIGLFAPFLAGIKPVLCQFQGRWYSPALGYYNVRWENNIFLQQGIRQVDYDPQVMREIDPESWVIWPLFYQDPVGFLDLQSKRKILEKEQDLAWQQLPTDFQQGPNPWHPLGTNLEGIDVLAAMIHGTSVAMLIGFVSTGISALIGIPIGALAGYFGGWVDVFISRIIEVFLCIPSIVLIMAIIAVVERPTIWHVMLVIGGIQWTGIARLTRGEFLRLKQLDYVNSAKALGAGHLRMMFRHILPNALAPVLVPITFGIAAAILTESGLSLLGLSGSSSPARWGALLNAAREGGLSQWWLVVFPGGAIFLSVLAYNLIGEGLQEATDPRLRNR